jgi:hypothetical protein
MPGDSPREAVNAFLDPLRRAVACIGPAKVCVSAGGYDALGKTHAWSLNDVRGMVAKGGWHFEAQMHYEIITDSRPGYGPYRVTTRAYRYRIALASVDIVRIHWHPVGQSTYTNPHVHLALDMANWKPGDPPPETIKQHLPTGRLTFEDAVTWALSIGMPAARSDWQTVLADCQAAHLQYRSWHKTPDEAKV